MVAKRDERILTMNMAPRPKNSSVPPKKPKDKVKVFPQISPTRNNV